VTQEKSDCCHRRQLTLFQTIWLLALLAGAASVIPVDSVVLSGYLDTTCDERLRFARTVIFPQDINNCYTDLLQNPLSTKALVGGKVDCLTTNTYVLRDCAKLNNTSEVLSTETCNSFPDNNFEYRWSMKVDCSSFIKGN